MKYVDLSGFPVAWNKIGTIPAVSAIGAGLGRPYVCIVNGYFSVFYPVCNGTNPQVSKGAVLYSFDGQGGMCTYQTSDFSVHGNQNNICNPNQIWQSNNTFVYALLNGNVWKMTIPNIFTAGATYILPPQVFLTPSPCGLGDYNHTIFCGEQGVYCNEFIQSFPDSSNYWASIYTQQGAFINGGYIGNSPSDLFDQRNNTLPPFVTTSNVYDRNGLVVYGNFSSVSANDQVVGTQRSILNGDATKLFCGGVDANNPVYVSGNNLKEIYYYRDYGYPAFLNSADSVICGITDITNAIVYPDINNVLLSAYYYVRIPTFLTNAPLGYLSKKKQLFQVNAQTNSGTVWGDVYMASFDLSAYGQPPLTQQSEFSGLANYHRAVSPNGTFQA